MFHTLNEQTFQTLSYYQLGRTSQEFLPANIFLVSYCFYFPRHIRTKTDTALREGVKVMTRSQTLSSQTHT